MADILSWLESLPSHRAEINLPFPSRRDVEQRGSKRAASSAAAGESKRLRDKTAMRRPCLLLLCLRSHLLCLRFALLRLLSRSSTWAFLSPLCHVPPPGHRQSSPFYTQPSGYHCGDLIRPWDLSVLYEARHHKHRQRCR